MRKAEAPQRAAVREQALARAGYRCEGAALIPTPCWGPLDCHEIEARGTHPGSHLNPEVVRVLCRGHHEWVGAHPRQAEEKGLRRRATK